ncbi:MAG TPA: 30S ribosomal protein S12 methylthiotransferase RimO [Actinomycetales bacterium]|nr:30S ribosomal protein S12 methylthiotransferase RimO [Actinomycetales bacterium]
MASRTVALVTLGCTRNEVDSEELAGRLEAGGWTLVDDAADADVAVVNTCGFVEQAKKDSIDVLLEASALKEDPGARTQAVVAVGCLAERYGEQLASSLPEADAVLGFDSYADMSRQLQSVLAGERPPSHVPRDRRSLLPLSPSSRQAAAGHVPGHDAVTVAGHAPDLPDGVGPASGPRVLRRRLDGRPWAPLKIASGCDRRCAFCAIPSFRGAFLSRPAVDVVAEARWLAEQGVREVFLVSENSTSYGKDLGDVRALERLLPQLAAVDGIERVRVSYLQPAEMRPGLLDVLTATPGVVPYFDLSFQHASAPLLRRMRRFGSRDEFVELVERVRARVPGAGIRSNVIVGFPGETEDDVGELERFLAQARLDVVGVFGYSDEDGTEAETFDDKVPDEVVVARLRRLTDLVEELTAQRAQDRVGEVVEVLVEQQDHDGEEVVGRALHQGPDVDGTTTVELPDDRQLPTPGVGALVRATVVRAEGVDLVARPVAQLTAATDVASIGGAV